MLFNTQADLGRCSSPIGIVIGQGFEIKSLIGKGAMGEVYHAIHPQFTSEDFAIKFLSEKIISSEMSRRFAREIKISASLGKKSPHIVKIKAYGLHNDSIPYYIMELLKGDTLANRMEESPLSLETFFNFTLQICSALKVAHEGIEIKGSLYPVIHRDLKPSNIFVSLDPAGQDTLKILDYGIAKLVGYKAKLTRTGHFLGTLGYCSPEQMQGEKVDHRADIYSLVLEIACETAATNGSVMTFFSSAGRGRKTVPISRARLGIKAPILKAVDPPPINPTCTIVPFSASAETLRFKYSPPITSRTAFTPFP